MLANDRFRLGGWDSYYSLANIKEKLSSMKSSRSFARMAFGLTTWWDPCAYYYRWAGHYVWCLQGSRRNTGPTGRSFPWIRGTETEWILLDWQITTRLKKNRTFEWLFLPKIFQKLKVLGHFKVLQKYFHLAPFWYCYLFSFRNGIGLSENIAHFSSAIPLSL